MHEEEVLWVFFLAESVDDSCCHRDCGDAGGADHRVDGVFGEFVHEFGEEDAGGCGDGEGCDAEDEDVDGLECEEVCGGGFGTDGDS